MPPRLLLIPLVMLAVLAVGVGSAAAPPPGPRAKQAMAKQAAANGAVAQRAMAKDTYAKLVAHGTPAAQVMRPAALRSYPGGPRVGTVGELTQWRSPRLLPALSRRGSWLQVLATELPNGGTAWIRMSAVRLFANPWSVVAEVSRRRVTVRRYGRVVRRFSVSVGARDTPTPIGRFAVTDRLALRGSSAAYGCCALALSGHQPNLSRGWPGGDRLAIHGTEQLDTLGRPASLGCLRARDSDARWMIRNVLLGTVVEIRP